jgi:hypothetical protein
MQTEFATKVAVLDGLVIACGALSLAPLLRRVPRALAPVAAAGALLLASIPARGAAVTAAPAPTVALPPIVISAEAQRTAGVDAAQARALVAQAVRHSPGPASRATVVVVRNPQRPQDAPRLAVELQGPSGTRTWAP